MTWRLESQARQLVAAETGTVRKDWGGRLPIALVFPNRYRVGMSSLAVHTLYKLWNDRVDVVCERVFTDLTPPYSLESVVPLDYFPIIALSLSYEMDYFGAVDLLEAAGIPALAEQRDETHPLVLAGGPAVSANPEPVAPLLDAVVIGEVEPIFASLTDALVRAGGDRESAISALGELPGVYLPHASDATNPVDRLWLRDLDAIPTHSVILTPQTEFANMGLIEIARGCGRGCRFCLAGYAFRPPRERSLSSILSQARDLQASTGRLGLVSAAVSDHSQIEEVAWELRALGASLSVSSMRVDPVSEPLVRALAESGAQTLTIAPEAGSDRLRRVINKTQTEDDVIRAVSLAAGLAFRQIKLYFMLGLPTEAEPDLNDLVNLVAACKERFPGQVTVNITPFVPKAHTPFERVAQTPAKQVARRLDYITSRLRPLGVTVKSESPSQAEIQGALARGDRNVGRALIRAGRPHAGAWRRALADVGLSATDMLRELPAHEQLPWHRIRSGIRPQYLQREGIRSLAARTSLRCPPSGCAACGVCPE